MQTNNRRNNQQKHISVPMSSPFYTYSENGEVRYITVQYWNGGIYMTFINRITEENVEEISFRMPEHVIKDLSYKLGKIMLERRNAYISGTPYQHVDMSYPIGSFQEDKIVSDGSCINVFTTDFKGSLRIVIEAKKGNLSIPILFYSDYVIADVSPENQNKLRYIDIYDTKIWSLYQALQTASTPLYRVFYNTAEQMIKAIGALIDEKMGSKKTYNSGGHNNSYGNRGSYQSKNYTESKVTETDRDEIPF